MGCCQSKKPVVTLLDVVVNFIWFFVLMGVSMNVCPEENRDMWLSIYLMVYGFRVLDQIRKG